MEQPDSLVLKDVTPESRPAPLPEAARAEVAALALRQRRAGGLLMKGITLIGAQVEDGMKLLPKAMRARIDRVAREALTASYDLAGRSRAPGLFGDGLSRRLSGDRAHKVMATVSGAIGGLGGLATALAELPVTTTVIFRAIQGVAAAHGEDPASPETRMECLRVFGTGGPGGADDGIDTSFIGARLSISGAALHRLIAQVAPRFAAVLSQKLATQAVPVLGAAAGAGTNYAFVDYYVEMAHVHFGLRRLMRDHDEGQVLDLFHAVLAEGRLPVAPA